MKRLTKALSFSIIAITITVFALFIILPYKNHSSEIKKLKKNERLYSMLLNSYYSTYYSIPQNIEQLSSFLIYLKAQYQDSLLDKLIINNKMELHYDQDKRILYLFYTFPDSFLKKSINIFESSKNLSFQEERKNSIIGGASLFDICENPLIFKAFYNGYPVSDSLVDLLITGLKPTIDSLQKSLISDSKANIEKTILVKGIKRNNVWTSKLICLKDDFGEKYDLPVLEEKIDSTLLNFNFNQGIDSIYFPLFYPLPY